MTDVDVAILRASIDGNADVVRAAADGLDGAGASAGLVALTRAAFGLAARRQFGPEWSTSDVIGFVAMVRAIPGGQPELLDPLVAEAELRSALGEDLPASPDPQARAVTQVVLLAALVGSLRLDDAGIDALIDEARQSSG
ncbi:MAG: hypothetical protein FWC87_14215 [Acidimicrobiaceae bacterium]|nr:hypothetical protein [Acidimicrobiaceae bacterium]